MKDLIMLTDNFSANEFACRCGKCEYSDPKNIQSIINHALLDKLQELRYAVKVPIIVNCGVRCYEHHKSIYQSRYGTEWERYIVGNSKHLIDEHNNFKAADITISGINPIKVFSFASYFRFNCVGWYMWEGTRDTIFFHVDVGTPGGRYYEKFYKR